MRKTYNVPVEASWLRRKISNPTADFMVLSKFLMLAGPFKSLSSSKELQSKTGNAKYGHLKYNQTGWAWSAH